MRRLIGAFLRPSDSGLFSRAMSAGFWAGTLRLILRGSLIIRTVILARLLAPDDFGLMAIATLSILLLERFTQSGIDSALVQRPDDIRPYLNTAWTLQIIRGLVMAAVLFVAAPYIARFFGAPEAELVIQVLSLGVVLRAFANIGVVSFVKELRFDRYFVLQMADRGTDIVVSIGAAFALQNVWALVLGALASALGRLIASYVIDEFRPRLQWVWSHVKQLFGFGKWILASNILNYATGSLDDILVGRMLGVQSLGWYRMAYNFSQAVATEITQVTNQVAFPTYSKLQGAADRLRLAYMGSLHLVAFLGFPIAIGTILVAPDLTYGILGEKWSPIVLPLQLLSVAGLIRGVSGTIGPLFESQGRPDIPPRFSFARLVLMAVVIVPAVNQFGLEGAAVTVTVAGAITGVPALALAIHTVGARRSELRQALVFPAFNTLSMVAAVLAARYAMFERPTTISFFALLFVGASAYVASVFLATRTLGYSAPTDLLRRVRQAAS